MPAPTQVDKFIGKVSDATQQYIDGAITSSAYLAYVAGLVSLFDDEFKEPESFKKAG